MCHIIFVFFFKQKTAYDMRISDWSSDVCSSDLYQQILCSPERAAAQPVSPLDHLIEMEGNHNGADRRGFLLGAFAPMGRAAHLRISRRRHKWSAGRARPGGRQV